MKIKLIIGALLCMMTLSSCSDAYEDNIDGNPGNSADVYLNAADVQSGLNVIYSSMPVDSEISLGSIFTDEARIGILNGNQGLLDGEYTFKMEADNQTAFSIWSSYYRMIYRINRLIDETERLSSQSGLPNDEKNAHKNNLADLYLFRAFCHYKLFAYFTPDYTNNSSLSVIILDHTPPVDYQYSLPRSTVKEVSDFIFSDIAKAVNFRQQGGGSWSNYNYMNAGVADAIKLKMYTLMEDYPNVIAVGESMIQKYSLANANQYKSYFSRVGDNYVPIAENNEIIFQLKATASSGPSPASVWYSQRPYRNGAIFQIGRALYNVFDELDPSVTGQQVQVARSDVRYSVNVLQDYFGQAKYGSKALLNYQNADQETYFNNDILLVGKFPGMDNRELGNNFPIFRTSDVWLCLAEARAAMGQVSSAFTDPNDIVGEGSSNVTSILLNIRLNRSVNPSAIVIPSISSQQEAYAEILKERRVEFAFEGYRYLDMKRLGGKAGSPGFVRYSKDCEPYGACELPASSHKLTLPIPLNEIQSNHLISADQQNPGY